MKIRIALLVVVLLSLLTGCQTAAPEPITTTIDTEFTLSIGQPVSVTDANLSITLLSVLSDDLEHVKLTRAFLNDPHAYLNHL